VKTGLTIAGRGMNHWLGLLITAGLVQVGYDKHRRRLGLHLRGSTFAGYRDRVMVRGFDVKLVKVKVGGSIDAQMR
jgi:hypothetical protein